MQVSLAAPRPFNFSTLSAPAQSAPPAETPQEPTDSFGGRLKKEVGRGLLSAGNDWDLAIGGGTALAVGIASVSAGVIGGALVGAALGGGLGPMVAAATSNGVMGFLGTAWTTTAIGAKVGMVVGAGTGLVGGFALGQTLGGIPAKGLRWTGKKMLGQDPDAGKETGEPKKLVKMTGPLKAVGTVVAGLGALSGGVGGMALGGGITATGTALSGLVSGNFSLGAVVATAGTGALIGGGIMLVAGAVGGYMAVKAMQKGVTATVDAAHSSAKWMELDEKESRLTGNQQQLDTLAKSLDQARADAQQNHADRTSELDQREDALKTQNERIADKNTRVDELVEKRAQNLYDTTKQGLVEREAGQDNRQTHLESEDARVNAKRADIDRFIDERQNKLYNELETKLEGQYQTRKGQLENRERELDRAQQNIPTVVAEKVEKTLQPLRRDLEDRIQNARRMEGQADNLRNQASADMAAIPGIRSQASSERSAADRAEREADSIRPDVSSLQGQVNSKRSQVESRKYDLQRREARVEQCERDKKKPRP